MNKYEKEEKFIPTILNVSELPQFEMTIHHK